MNLATLTPAQITRFQKINEMELVDSTFYTDKLARLQNRFALAQARYQLALDMEDMLATHRSMVTLTVSGPTGTLTFDASDIIDDCQLSTDARQVVRLIKEEIMEVLTNPEAYGGQDTPNPVAKEFLALMQPAPATPAAPACPLAPVAA